MVRLGIIGIGGMGRGHAGYLSKGEVAGARLTAVCDISPDALEWARTTLGENVALFDDAEALFDSGTVDAVLIATPHYFHPPLAIAALQHNLHALVEKPAGVYTKQVREMNEVAAKSDKILGIMFNQRTRGVHQKMKDIVSSGELGEIKRVTYIITDWFRSQAYYDSGGWRATWAGEGGGTLVNQCPHNLDLWQWICGKPSRIRAFCGFGKYHNIEVEDDVTAYVQYPNGATGVFIATTGEAPGTQSFEIAGDRGKLLLQDNNLTFWRTREPVSSFLQTSKDGFAMPEIWKCEIPAHGGGEHIEITRNWIAAIAEGKPLLARGEEGINSVEIANAILMSTWTDDWVNLPIDEDRYYELLQERIATSTYKKPEDKSKSLNFEGTF
jgi:predicted dehydrogenase